MQKLDTPQSQIGSPNSELLTKLHAAVKEERQITLQVLELLKQVEACKLYLTLGFGSLMEFCIKELHYSESAAYRRISAMKALSDVPVLERKIADGSLSLHVISQVQSHIRQKEKQTSVRMELAEKKILFETLEGLSTREAEKELIKLDPQGSEAASKRESIRQITPELQEMKLILTPEMQQDLEKLKLLLSHAIPGASLFDVLRFAVKESIQKRDLQREMKTPKRKAQPAPAENVPEKTAGIRIQLPTSVKRLVWKKHQGQCSYQHLGRRCSSRFQLEIDHVVSLARGGANSISNLQLLCRSHNQMKGSD